MEMKVAQCKETARYKGGQPWLRHHSICKGQHLQQEENFPAALSSQEQGKYLEKYNRCLLFVWSVVFNDSRQVLGADSCESPPPSINIQSWLLRSKGCAALKLGAKRLGCCYSCPTRLRLVCQAAEAADSLKGYQTEVLQLVLWRNS